MPKSDPVIAILTPTKGRSKHLAFQISQVKRINYPADKIRWIITDTECPGHKGWQDIVKLWPSAIYKSLPPGTPLGKSRNIGLDLALADPDVKYIFLMDDDDIINVNRFRKHVDIYVKLINEHGRSSVYPMLGSSSSLIYNIRSKTLIRTIHYKSTHSLEPHLCITRDYAETHRFDDNDFRGRLMPFTEKFSINIYQIPPEDTCIIIGHNENTFDKYQLEDGSLDINRNIESSSHMLLQSLFDMFEVPEEDRVLFERAYRSDILERTCKTKSHRFLKKLEIQMNEKIISKEVYTKAKNYLTKHNIDGNNRFITLESVIYYCT